MSTQPTQQPTQNEAANASSKKSIIFGVGIVVVAMVLLALSGFIFFGEKEDIITGQVEADEVRIAGKVPGRITEFLVSEGQSVHRGDTLVRIYSPEVLAKLEQAQAAKSAAEAQSQKAQLVLVRSRRKVPTRCGRRLRLASRSQRRASSASSASTRKASSPHRSTTKLPLSSTPCALPSVLLAASMTWR